MMCNLLFWGNCLQLWAIICQLFCFPTGWLLHKCVSTSFYFLIWRSEQNFCLVKQSAGNSCLVCKIILQWRGYARKESTSKAVTNWLLQGWKNVTRLFAMASAIVEGQVKMLTVSYVNMIGNLNTCHHVGWVRVKILRIFKLCTYQYNKNDHSLSLLGQFKPALFATNLAIFKPWTLQIWLSKF